MPLLQLVIPTHNRPRDALKLVLELTPLCDSKVFTITVVDDDSDPNNRIILESEIVHCEGVNYRYLNGNIGAPAARNLGASLSNSEWIWYFDDDDFVTIETVRTLLKRLQVPGLKDLVFLSSNNVYPAHKQKLITPDGSSIAKRFSRKGQDINTSCVIFSRGIIDKLKGWDESLVAGQDTDILLRASLLTDADVFQELIVEVRHHDGERITNNSRRQLLGKVQFLKKNYRLLHWTRVLRYLATILILYPYTKRYFHQ